MTDLQSWEEDPALYLFTSLTAGSSHIVTATSRIETILKNARIPFSYIDTATNESARKLYGRRGKNKKLPLLVKEGFVIADLEQIEEWNEFGELQSNIGDAPTTSTSVTSTPAKPGFGSTTGSAAGTPSKLAVATPQSNASSPAAEREVAERQKETASIGSIKNNPFMRQLAGEAAGVAKGRAFGKPKLSAPKEPLADQTNSPAGQPTSTASDTSPTAAITSTSDIPLASPVPKSPNSPLPEGHMSRHSSTGSSRHATPFIPEHPSPVPLQHRGSEISLASQDEIREIERSTAIPEEDEGDDGDGKPCVPVPAKGKTSASAMSVSAKAADDQPSDSPSEKAHGAISSLDGAADEEPNEEVADFAKKLERAGTDLSLMEDEQNVSSPTIAERSMTEESHADTPAASAPIERFEAQLGRTGTDLSLMEEKEGVDAEEVNEEEMAKESHIDTSKSGHTSAMATSDQKHEPSGSEQPKKEAQDLPQRPKAEDVDKLEQTLSRTGTDLQQALDSQSPSGGSVKPAEHASSVEGSAQKAEVTDIPSDAREAEKAGESVED